MPLSVSRQHDRISKSRWRHRISCFTLRNGICAFLWSGCILLIKWTRKFFIEHSKVYSDAVHNFILRRTKSTLTTVPRRPYIRAYAKVAIKKIMTEPEFCKPRHLTKWVNRINYQWLLLALCCRTVQMRINLFHRLETFVGPVNHVHGPVFYIGIYN